MMSRLAGTQGATELPSAVALGARRLELVEHVLADLLSGRSIRK